MIKTFCNRCNKEIPGAGTYSHIGPGVPHVVMPAGFNVAPLHFHLHCYNSLVAENEKQHEASLKKTIKH